MAENKIHSEERRLIAERTVEGKSARAIAEELDVNVGTVISHQKKDPKVRALITRLQNKLLDNSLETSVDNILHAVGKYQTTEKTQEKDHGFKASLRVAESVGILSGAGGLAIQVNNIYNDNRQEIPDVIKDFLTKRGETDVLDAEYKDIE